MIEFDIKDVPKAVLPALECETNKMKEGPFCNINKENAILFLNTIGNEESICFVAKHICEMDCSEIMPERLEEVLKSDFLHP